MSTIKSPLINNWTDNIARRESNTGLTANAVGRIFSGIKLTSAINIDTIQDVGIFRFDSSTILTGTVPPITKPTEEDFSGFLEIRDNRPSNYNPATESSSITQIRQIIYPDAVVVTASSDLGTTTDDPNNPGTTGLYKTVTGSAPYTRTGVKFDSTWYWTEWTVLGSSGGLNPVVLSRSTDRPTDTVVVAKPNVLYIAFAGYHISLPNPDSVPAGTQIAVEQHFGESIIRENDDYWSEEYSGKQILASPESSYSLGYVKSEDTTVDLSKSYYTRTGAGTTASPYVYTLVTATTENPSTSNYYERSIVGGTTPTDASIRYTFECVFTEKGVTSDKEWVLDVDGNHGAAIDLINERITESNNRITRLEEVLVPAKGKKLVHITAGTLPSSLTILTDLTTTSKADIDNLYNFKLYDQIYSIKLSEDETVKLPSIASTIASTFAGGKIVINVYNSTSDVHTFTLKQTINDTEYSSAFKVLPELTNVFELTFEHTYQDGSTIGVHCWLLNSAAPLDQQ